MIIGKMLSVVVPCYNEEDVINIFYEAIKDVLDRQTKIHGITWELWFVDDGSTDYTLEQIKILQKNDERVHYVSFSRNFGKEAAIYAGLEAAWGDYVVTMDVDLQDPPELIEEMLWAVISEGYDCVATRRSTRKGEPVIRSFFAKMFYRILNRMSKTGVVDGARDYRLMTRAVVDAILQMKEYNRFTKGIYEWVGFKTKYLEYENVERAAGQTKWSFWKLFKYSVEGIVAFSTMPLVFASAGGIFLCGISFIVILILVIRALLYGDPVPGWPSLACITIFLSGLQLFSNGVLGIYLSKTYLESKHRPIYVAKEKV